MSCRIKANHNAPHVCRDERVRRMFRHVRVERTLSVTSKTFRPLMLLFRINTRVEIVRKRHVPN